MNKKLPRCGYLNGKKCSHKGIGKYCRYPKNQFKCECYNEWYELVTSTDEPEIALEELYSMMGEYK